MRLCLLFGVLSGLNGISEKRFENDFFKVVAYILLSIEIFKGYFGRVSEVCEET